MVNYTVFVDGAARGLGADEDGLGEGAAACMIYKNGHLIGQVHRGLGRVDSNTAEYEAVYLGALLCWSANLENPIIYTDSQTVYDWITGEKQPPEQFHPIHLSLQMIRNQYPFKLVHVGRRVVREADRLANYFLDELHKMKANDNDY